MADMPNYNGALQAATQRRDAALQRLMMLGQARQRFTNMMYMKQKAQMAEAERKRKEFESEGNKSATGEALGGAALGATIGSIIPGVGTAVGAGVGALAGFVGGSAIGMMESKAQYKKEGKHFGFGEAMRSLPGVADIDQASRGKWDSSYANPQAIAQLAMTGARVGASQGTAAAGPNYAAGETETGFVPVYSQDPYQGSSELANAWDPDAFSRRTMERIHQSNISNAVDSAPYPALLAFK